MKAPPRALLVLLASAVLFVLKWGAPAAALQPAEQRIVFVGDSITDGDTYPQLVRQALADAGRRTPVCINAGVAGDTAKGMRKRLERDVLVHRPTLVTLSAGINDVLGKVDPAEYEDDVAAIAERLKAEKVPLLLLTTSILGRKHAEADKRLDDFNAALERVAKKHGCRVADVNRRMRQARAKGADLLEADQVHPNWDGQRILARAVLDALGHKDVPLPRDLKLDVLPGVIRTWHIQAVRGGQPPWLDDKAVKAIDPLKLDESWKPYGLPETKPVPAWWFDHERRRGFALSLNKAIGPASRYRGLATLDAPKGRKVFFNTGAQLETVWLNGKRLFKSEGWTGWHAGKERVPAYLQAGRNIVVIETGGQFFLSVTDDNKW